MVEGSLEGIIGRVARIIRWPVIGLGGECLDSATLTPNGVYLSGIYSLFHLESERRQIHSDDQRKYLRKRRTNEEILDRLEEEVPYLLRDIPYSRERVDEILEQIRKTALPRMLEQSIAIPHEDMHSIYDRSSPTVQVKVKIPEKDEMDIIEAVNYIKGLFGINLQILTYVPKENPIKLVGIGSQSTPNQGGSILVDWSNKPNYEIINSRTIRIGNVKLKINNNSNVQDMYASFVPGEDSIKRGDLVIIQ